MVEELTEPASSRTSGGVETVSPTPMDAVTVEDAMRLPTAVAEFDRVLGGGLVPGSVSLVGGEPGIGKSTLLLSVAGSLSRQGTSVLYVTGEESERQMKLRATRLGLSGAAIQLLAHTRLEVIVESIRQKRWKRFRESELIEILTSAVQAGKVQWCKLKPHVQKKIPKN